MVRYIKTKNLNVAQSLYNRNLIYKTVLNNITMSEEKRKNLVTQINKEKNKNTKKKLETNLKRITTLQNKKIDELVNYNNKIKNNRKLIKQLPKAKTFKDVGKFNKKKIQYPAKMVNYRFTVFYWSRGHNYRKKDGTTGKLRNRNKTFQINGKYTLRDVLKLKSKIIDSYFLPFGNIFGVEQAKGQINDIKNGTTQKIYNGTFNKVTPEDLRYYYHVIHTVQNTNLLQQAKGNILNMPVKYIHYNKLPLDIEANNEKIDENCVTHFLKKELGKTKGFIKKIKKLDIDNWTVEKIFNYLDTYNIWYKAYNQSLRLIKENKTEERNNKIKTLTFILSNEHLYSVTKKEIEHLFNVTGKRENISEIKYVENAHKEVFKTIQERPVKKLSICYDDEMNELVDRYISENTMYTDDMYVMDIYKFAKEKFDFVPLTFNFSVTTPLRLLLNNDHYSHVINYMNIPTATQYNDLSINDCMTIDKNKAYGYILENMEYIPVITFNHKVEELKETPLNIDENVFYLVNNVHDTYYNMIHIGWQTGHSLANVPRNYFTVSHCVKPTLVKNPLREYLRDLREYSTDLYKTTYSVFSGMCLKTSVDSSLYYGNITNSFDETGEFKNDFITLSDKENNLYVETFMTAPKEYISKSLLPLGHFIFGNMKKLIINKIKELNCIHPVNIRTINTDSLTFSFDIYKHDHTTVKNAYDKVRESLNNKDINCWKFEDKPLYYGEYSPVHHRNYLIKEIPQISMESIDDDILLNNNILFNCNAGSGKTYYTLNKIIPILEKNEKSYVVLSTKHCIEKMYTEKDKTATVIHTFLYNDKQKKKLGNYDYIIIDECGLLEGSHYKLLLENMKQFQRIIFLGDYSQLSPIGHEAGDDSYINKQQIRKLFNLQVRCTDNYRNNYTPEEYEEMKNGKYKITDFERKFIFNSKVHDLDKVINSTNICITRNYMDKLNKIIVDKLGFTETITGVKVKRGEPLIAEFRGEHSRRLKLQNKYGVFNAFNYTLVDFNDTDFTLKTENDKLLNIPVNLFKDNFNYPYCKTLFRAQGESIPIEKYLIHEIDKMIITEDNKDSWNGYADDVYNRRLYTALSRVKVLNQ